MASDQQYERYMHGHSPEAVENQLTRSASSEGSFFLPYLQPGMSLLDCGCGPGGITLGLAQAVNPGRVTGVDMEQRVIEQATVLAQENGVDNVSFQVGNIYQLDFPDDSFDAVFAHAIIQHLAAPERALQEILRVLRPDGLVGIRAIDLGTVILTPSNPVLVDYLALIERVWRHNGGNPRVGRILKTLLYKAGFGRCEGTASFEYFGEPVSLQGRCQRELNRINNSDTFQVAVEQGWVDNAALETMSAAWREFGQAPDSFYAVGMCEAIGWKE